jgi:hypothetical protein
MTTLIERLRNGRHATWLTVYPVMCEAADALESLSAELAEVRRTQNAAAEAEREACVAILSDARKRFTDGAGDLRNDDQKRLWYPYIAREFADVERAIRSRAAVTTRAIEALTNGGE